jgi:hypothetical protein
MLFGFEVNDGAPSFPLLSWRQVPPLTELVEGYVLPEERLAVKIGLPLGEGDALAVGCQAARQLAEKLQSKVAGRCPHRLAETLGIEVIEQRWGIVAGRFFQWGECTRRPDRIVLNQWAIEQVTRGITHWGQPCQLAERVAGRLPDLILAHELHHWLLADAGGLRALPLARELAAHSFARTFCEAPFSPLLYDRLVILATERGTDHFVPRENNREFRR